ncbi:MAG: alpha-2-macroglobulin family protein [bacterium]|nr:alpha-2-macroglobulin family protein [bacterium]
MDTLKANELMVSNTLPDSGELSLVQTISINFMGANLDQPDSTSRRLESLPAQLRPAVSGHWVLNNPGSLLFIPEEPYEPNTKYKVILDPEFFIQQNLKLRGPSEFKFHALPFAYTSINLQRLRDDTLARTHRIRGTVQFNYPVSPEDFTASLTLKTYLNKVIAFSLESTSTSREQVFISEALESEDQDYIVSAIINESLTPQGSRGSLEETITRKIVVPALERVQIKGINLSSNEDLPVVEIQFSDSVAPEDLQAAITIDPPVENLKFTGRWGSVSLTGNWLFDQSYKIEISGEMVAQNGLRLERKFTRSLMVDDLNPMLRIAGPGNYLSLHGEGKVGIETINMDAVNLRVERVFSNNIVSFLQDVRLSNHRDYYYDWNLANTGETLVEREISIPPSQKNKTQLTAVDLNNFLTDDSRGIFRLVIEDPKSRYNQDGRWIVATDLGLVAKQAGSDIEVAVASINRLEPTPGVKVQVLSRNNQVIASGGTNHEGLVSFHGLSWNEEGGRPFVVTASKGQDLSFLAFDQTRIRTADLDVGGVEVNQKGYRAYLYGDRDIYRPGETAHLVWMVRDSHLQPPSGFPLNLKIMAPGGQEFLDAKVQCDEAGSGEFSFEIPNYASTGNYTVLLFLGQDHLLGEKTLSVEDFIPDRMKVTSEIREDGQFAMILGPDSHPELRSTAMTLFGPPAADRLAEASLWFRPAEVIVAGFEDFSFGDPLKEKMPPRRELGQLQTDADGHVQWDLPLPEVADYQGWMTATALVKVTESGGGRAVSSSCEATFSPNKFLMGLRNLDSDNSDYTEPGETLRFQGVMVNLDGVPQPQEKATLKLMRRQWRTVLKRDGNGSYHYISEYDEKLISENTVTLKAGPTDLEVVPNSHGSYRLVLTTSDGNIRGSIGFYVYGFGYAPWAMSNPDKVNLKLDRETYADGDVVTASVEAPFPGLMLLTVEREKVYSRQWFRMTSNTGTVQVGLPEGVAPNVYLTATLLRPLSDLDPRAPARAFGAAPIFVDRSGVTLPVEVSAPEEMRPLNPVNIRVRLPHDDTLNSEAIRVTVAAVDEGILQLTDYESPSALDYFLQKRRLSVDSFDIWSLLLPEFEKVRRKSAAGGGVGNARDAMAPKRASRLNPLAADRVKPVALWSGLLKGKKGWQDISFDVPEFNGTLRVMVLASAADRFGAAETSVVVADPLVLSPSLPRFLAPGDQIRVPVPVYNDLPGNEDELFDVKLDLDLQGPINVNDGFALNTILPVGIGREKTAWFDLKATSEIGIATVGFNAAAGGEKIKRSTELSVRPIQALDSRVHTGVVNLTEPFSETLNNRWYPGTARTTITVAANPVAQFGAALPYLLRYPYGCTEQITSRTLPLLYFGDLAAQVAPRQFAKGDADYYVNSGLDYVTTMFHPGRGFSMWPGRNYGTSNSWTNIYVTHFLLEAEKKGYVLPENLLEGALKVVQKYARSTDNGWPSNWTRSHRLRSRAYAIYVLALADRADRGAMDQMARSEWENLTPASRTHLAGAYALIGNMPRFEELLPLVDAPVDGERSTGYSWYSLARDEAMRLDVLATVAANHDHIPRLMQRLGQRAENGRWYNTQENAFALLAIGKLSASGMLDPADGIVLVDGQMVASFSAEDAAEGLTIQSAQWAGKSVEIKTTTAGSAWFTILDEGIPKEPKHDQYDSGLVVRRDYFNTEGEPVNLQSLTQGQSLVCRLSLVSNKGKIEDVVISDLLAACLEIENPRLTRNGGYDWIEKDLEDNYQRLEVQNLEIRDDRLLLFTRVSTKESVFYYSLRAVTQGSFALPQVRAEAMYDPEVMSVRGGGEIRVVQP